MFNSTHTFIGFAIARLGPEKWGRGATATAVIASNLPDIDSVAGFWGTAVYLDHHRGITHSLIGVPILALLLSAVMYFFSGNFGRTFAIALIAMATHPLLDYLNPYGWRPFLPFDDTWYYGDLVFILDPYLDASLFLGLIAGSLWPHRKRLATVSSLLLVLTYIGVRYELHERAISRMQPLVAGFPQTVEKWAVLPNVWSLRTWNVIIQSKTGMFRFDVDGPPRQRIETPVVRADVDVSSDLLARATAAPSTAALLRFARFPVARVRRLASGYRVTWFDFRFYRESTDTALAAEVTLDESLQVVEEDISFALKLDDDP